MSGSVTGGAAADGSHRREERLRRKRDEILEAATEVFLRCGYAGTSMDEITRTAGVSKATVYSHFAGKETLFGAIIEARCRELISPLFTGETEREEPAQVLRSVAGRFMDLVLGETALALYRVVIAEAPRFPELARAFYDNGPARAIASLAAYLADEAERGRLRIPAPVTAAEQFLGLLTGYLHVRTVLGIAPSPPAPQRAGHIEETVDMFLRAYGTGAAREEAPAP